MKTIIKCEEYEILNTEGLKYETSLTKLCEGKNTHLPVFDITHNLFVKVASGFKVFIPKRIVYAFRYYDEYGILSEPWTAIFFSLEGEEQDCVILGRYAQSPGEDYLDSLSPFDDFYGRFILWKEYPKIFFYDKAGNQPYEPTLVKARVSHNTL